MKKNNKIAISIKLIKAVLLINIIILSIMFIYVAKNKQNNGIEVAEQNIVLSRNNIRTSTSRGEIVDRTKDTEVNKTENNEENSTEIALQEQYNSISEENSTEITLQEQYNPISEENSTEITLQEQYIPISEVKISQNMDLTVRTGLSKDDFISLISNVKQDTSGFFEQNAGTIYDLCEKYSLNEIFFCGIISAESGWDIASNHRKIHNYISLMSNGKLIKYSSVYEGLETAASKLHKNYLTPGGKFYYGKTLKAVKAKFCPSSSTWVNLVYGRMQQII